LNNKRNTFHNKQGFGVSRVGRFVEWRHSLGFRRDCCCRDMFVDSWGVDSWGVDRIEW